MEKQKKVQKDVVSQLLEEQRTSQQKELAALKALEQSGKSAEFTRALIAFDKRESLRGLKDLKGLDQKKINPTAFRLATSADRAAELLTREAALGPSIIAGLITQKQLTNDYIVPFVFSGLRTFSSMSGPDQQDVRQGLLGAIRIAADEYMVTNPGDTIGKTRVSVYGQMHLYFTAIIPQTGSYVLLMPAGNFWVRGSTRVVGHGNTTTSYDAKIWVNNYMVLGVGSTLLEISGGEIHYDGTRSEDRTKPFNHDIVLEPRYVSFYANGGDELMLSFQLDVHTEANEDGIAIAIIDAYGLPANTKSDYDTIVVKNS